LSICVLPNEIFVITTQQKEEEKVEERKEGRKEVEGKKRIYCFVSETCEHQDHTRKKIHEKRVGNDQQSIGVHISPLLPCVLSNRMWVLLQA
jgi:transcription antitermination factor NusG